MDKSKEKIDLDQEELVRNYFSTYAEEYYKENYDESLKNCYSYSHIVRKDHILRMFDKEGGKVLDIGCGPGVITLYLLQRGSEVWGVDISEEMIEETAKQIEKMGFKDVAHFSTGDITSLDFPDGYFDAVICSGVIEYLEDEELAIKEIYRVLKPDGIAIITVPTSQRLYTLMLGLSKFVLKPFISKLKEIKYKRIKRGYRCDSPVMDFEREFTGRYYRPKQLDKLVIDNNFKKVDYAHYHFISLFLALIAPSLSLYLGERLDKVLYKSQMVGWLSKGYIVKVKK